MRIFTCSYFMCVNLPHIFISYPFPRGFASWHQIPSSRHPLMPHPHSAQSLSIVAYFHFNVIYIWNVYTLCAKALNHQPSPHWMTQFHQDARHATPTAARQTILNKCRLTRVSPGYLFCQENDHNRTPNDDMYSRASIIRTK